VTEGRHCGDLGDLLENARSVGQGEAVKQDRALAERFCLGRGEQRVLNLNLLRGQGALVTHAEFRCFGHS